MCKNIFNLLQSFLIKGGPLLGMLIYMSIAFVNPAVAEPTSNYANSNQSGQTQVEARSEVDQHRQQAEEQAQKSLVTEAIEAIEETQKAVKELTNEKGKEALVAIERATGKISILLARYPEKSLLPVDFQTQVIDMAPFNLKRIKEIGKTADKAVEHKKYPEARLWLDMLRSEINVRTYHLPLATYPLVLKDAARLVELKKLKDAATTLITGLNTLIIIDKVIPIPIVNAKIWLKLAEDKREQDKDAALKFMGNARHELERAKELGYSGKDEEYASLSQAIEGLEKQVKAGKSSAAGFKAIKDKLAAFFKRQCEAKKPESQSS